MLGFAQIIQLTKKEFYMFLRSIEKTLARYATFFPIVALLGPRQSGKTTLVKHCFKKHKYFSLEDPNTRLAIQNDIKYFFKINENKHGIIIDEFQYIPTLTSYLQIEADAKKQPGYFVIAGSQNYLMNLAIRQSMAGRVGILTLLPLSIKEISKNKLLIDKNIDEIMFYGGYPRIYEESIAPSDYFQSYIQTYVERDVRQLLNIENLTLFQKFMGLCAGRIGQLLNIESLGNDCGISFNTARSWLSILQASYTIFLLQPHFKNFNKRLTKSPKLYFHDTGLACSLLRIPSPDVLATYPLRGNIFESFIIADLYKQFYNMGKQSPLYFWRDLNGRHEIDCIIDNGTKLIPVEIKSGLTISKDFFNGIEYWNNLANNKPEDSFIVYAGEENQTRSLGNIISWKNLGNLVERL
jgi:predicted AAA+ superfamily ATPase